MRSSWARNPTMSIPSDGVRSRVISSPTASGSAPAIFSRAPVRRLISGHARSRTCSPFRGSWRPAKTTVCSRFPGSAWVGTSTPLGTTSHGPPSQRSADSRARSETAIRWSTRSIRNPQPGIPSFIQPRSPEAWCVATIGSVASDSTATQIAGVIGSWRWSTSNRSRASVRRIRKTVRGLSADVGERPVRRHDHRPARPGSRSAAESPCRPTRGCSTRVNWPGGSLAMIRRTSCPRASSAAPGAPRARRPLPRTTTRTARRCRSSQRAPYALRAGRDHRAAPGTTFSHACASASSCVLREAVEEALVDVLQVRPPCLHEARPPLVGDLSRRARADPRSHRSRATSPARSSRSTRRVSPLWLRSTLSASSLMRSRPSAHPARTSSTSYSCSGSPCACSSSAIELADERRVDAEEPPPGGDLQRASRSVRVTLACASSIPLGSPRSQS